MRVNIINLVPRGAVGDENGFGSARGGGLGKGQKVKSAEVWRGQQRRQNNGWESFRDYVSINQVLRGTAGKENGVGKARGGEPGRGTESKECRGGEGAAVAAAAEQ